MKIVIVGAGIVGLSSAWHLWRDGHAVTVVDRGEDVGLAASHANGGQLSYRYVAPLADPDVLPKIPGWMLRRDAPVRFRPRFDPDQWRWLMSFLKACNGHDKLRSVASLLPLSLYSQSLVHELLAEHDLDFDHTYSGKLVVHRDRRTFDSARKLLSASADLASEQQALDTDACIALEPALERLRGKIAGAIHTRGEEAADCLKLCRELAARMQRGNNPVRLVLGAEVQTLESANGRLVALSTQTERFTADAFVMAAGADAARLLRPLGIIVPIYPVKGYSISVPITESAHAPAISVTDFQRKIVYARLGERLRVAGMADIGNSSMDINPARIATLVKETVAHFGAGVDASLITPWSGLRPATPTGRPIIGSSGIENLWLNVGHGALGLTLAQGSARLLADRIAGREPAVPYDDFRLDASAPDGWKFANAS
jgi:D-amino-acid dehydrogenase